MSEKYIPLKPSQYDGLQIIFNSDRIVLNSKKDSIFLSGDKSISLSTKGTINFDSSKHFIVNSSKIYLGLNSHKESQAILLGNNTYNLLSKIIDTLNTISNELNSVISTPTGTTIPQLSMLSAKISAKIPKMREDLAKILSKKSFVE